MLFAYVNHVYVSYELSTKTDTVTHKPGAETDGWMDRRTYRPTITPKTNRWTDNFYIFMHTG